MTEKYMPYVGGGIADVAGFSPKICMCLFRCTTGFNLILDTRKHSGSVLDCCLANAQDLMKELAELECKSWPDMIKSGDQS